MKMYPYAAGGKVLAVKDNKSCGHKDYFTPEPGSVYDVPAAKHHQDLFIVVGVLGLKQEASTRKAWAYKSCFISLPDEISIKEGK